MVRHRAACAGRVGRVRGPLAALPADCWGGGWGGVVGWWRDAEEPGVLVDHGFQHAAVGLCRFVGGRSGGGGFDAGVAAVDDRA